MPMKNILLIFVIAFTLQSQCLAQTFDPAWAARFQTVLDSIVKANNIKGASAAVMVPGQGTWTGVSGISSKDVPVTPDMRFGIESNTKLFTTVMMLQLQEKGLLSLNDSLDKWLPNYKNVDSTITIRQLLSHQSGINGHYWDTWFALATKDTTHFWTLDETMKYVYGKYFSPGKGVKYSNANYVLAGMIIETVTGKSWLENLHTLILDPLNLDETFAAAFEAPNGPVAHEWYGNTEYKNSPIKSAYSLLYAGGSMFSTARDMVKWYSELFGGNVIADSSLHEILSFEPTVLFGLGVTANYARHLHYGSTGSSLGYKSTVFYDPQNKSAICMLTNSGPVQLNEFGNLTIRPLLKVQSNNYPRQANDAAIVAVVKPTQHVFSAAPVPEVTIHNNGTVELTAADVFYRLNKEEPYEFQWTGSLKADSTASITLPSMDLNEGLYQFTVYTSNPNGKPDEYKYNDTIQTSFIRHAETGQGIPFTEDFEGSVFPPEGWITDSNTLFRWQVTSIVAYQGSKSAIRNNCFDNDNKGKYYDLDMPIIDLSGAVNPRLNFNYASTFIPDWIDSMAILISADQGKNWDTLFYKGGADLATAPYYGDPFFPKASEWKNVKIPLAKYVNSTVLIRFRDINRWGNNHYLDLVKIEEQPVGMDDLISKASWQVYPNPAAERITITGLPIHTELKILDVHGRLIQVIITDKETMSIPVNKFPKGLYILKTTAGMQKLMVQ